jgi:hypothetical protein
VSHLQGQVDVRLHRQDGGSGQGQVAAHHEDVPVGAVDQGEKAVHHGVAQGDEGADAPQLQGVQDVWRQDLENRWLITLVEWLGKIEARAGARAS